MPCKCDYLEPHEIEIEVGRLFLLLDEIERGELITRRRWADAGMDRRSYNKATKAIADELTERACSTLRNWSNKKIATLTLEAQMWWRDHKKADRRAGR